MREGSVPSEQYKLCNLIMHGGACTVLLFCPIMVQYRSILKLQLSIAQLPVSKAHSVLSKRHFFLGSVSFSIAVCDKVFFLHSKWQVCVKCPVCIKEEQTGRVTTSTLHISDLLAHEITSNKLTLFCTHNCMSSVALVPKNLLKYSRMCFSNYGSQDFYVTSTT